MAEALVFVGRTVARCGRWEFLPENCLQDAGKNDEVLWYHREEGVFRACTGKHLTSGLMETSVEGKMGIRWRHYVRSTQYHVRKINI